MGESMNTNTRYKPEYESRFTLGGRAYIAVPKQTMTCAGCVFRDDTSGCFKSPSCVPSGRHDARLVYFVKEQK